MFTTSQFIEALVKIEGLTSRFEKEYNALPHKQRRAAINGKQMQEIYNRICIIELALTNLRCEMLLRHDGCFDPSK